MSTELSTGKIVPGTNRNEALLGALRTDRQIRDSGVQHARDLHDVAVALAPAHHDRNIKARKANKAAYKADKKGLRRAAA